MRTLLVIVAVVSLFACGKKTDEKAKKMAALCTEASDMLTKEIATADDETVKMMLGNVLSACSDACDRKDQPSCTKLETAVGVICKSAPSMCETLCQKVDSPSLKKVTCAAAKK
jgi:hypothetical protein